MTKNNGSVAQLNKIKYQKATDRLTSQERSTQPPNHALAMVRKSATRLFEVVSNTEGELTKMHSL